METSVSTPTIDRRLERVIEEEPHHENGAEIEVKPVDKVTAFSLQLIEEFLAQHKLDTALQAMQAELIQKGMARPDSQLWFEMYNSCRGVLNRADSSCHSTLEKLVASCASSRTAGTFALDIVAPPVTLCCASPQPNSISKLKQASFSLRQAHSQMLSPVVRPSQRRHHKHGSAPSTPLNHKKDSSRPESRSETTRTASRGAEEDRPSSSLKPVEAPLQLSPGRKHKPKKKRDRNNNRVQPHHHPSRTESSMVMAYDEQIKRDLTSGRILARELRILRSERVKCDTLRRSSASLEAALARHDPYAKELVRERYGFIQRVECALCTFPFLPVNLPHRVSFKCIMDLHEFWGYEPPQRELAARYRPPLCYDAVSVCSMCGPILFERTTATPNMFEEPLSPTIRRAVSLNALGTSPKTSASPKARPAADGEQKTFCSDPYALPPLFGDDVIEDRDNYWGDEASGEARGNGIGPILESSAKAIVYSQQTDTAAFMSSKEWEVISPLKSNIRQVMEDSVKAT